MEYLALATRMRCAISDLSYRALSHSYLIASSTDRQGTAWKSTCCLLDSGYINTFGRPAGLNHAASCCVAVVETTEERFNNIGVILLPIYCIVRRPSRHDGSIPHHRLVASPMLPSMHPIITLSPIFVGDGGMKFVENTKLRLSVVFRPEIKIFTGTGLPSGVLCSRESLSNNGERKSSGPPLVCGRETASCCFLGDS